MAQYRVLIQHDGDHQYWQGDKRTMAEADAKHLVDLGVLEPIGTKSEDAPANKAEGPAPSNKAARSRKRK